jgi:hypothetical protein
MVDLQCHSLRWIGLVAAVGLMIGGQAAGAQQQEELEAPDQAAPAQRQVAMNREQFQQWVEQIAIGSSEDELEARGELETMLALKIDQLERTCGISSIQKKKLQLAGTGDIKRFFDRLDDHRRKYDQIKDDQQAFGKLQIEIQELANRRGNQMFAEGSIFGKTLARVLTVDQTSKIETALRRARSFRHRAKIDLVVQSLDIVVGLSDEQRERLTQLLERETRPARNSFVDFDAEVVIAQAAQFPESKIRPIFDADQWRVVAPLLQTLKQSFQETLHDIPLIGFDEPSLRAGGQNEARRASPDPEKSPGK